MRLRWIQAAVPLVFGSAIVAALALGLGVRGGTQTAHSQVTGSIVLGCGYLAGAVDGNTADSVTAADTTAACTGGLSAAKIDAIAGDADHDNIAGEAGENGIGDNDGRLEASDFSAIDIDGNQIVDGSTTATYVFAFVNNDGAVLFDSQTGLYVAVNDDGNTGDPVAPSDDGNTETCGVSEGLDDDCGTAVLSNGDGVVVATLTENTSAGASVGVDMSQSGGAIDTQTIHIVTVAETQTPTPTPPAGGPANDHFANAAVAASVPYGSSLSTAGATNEAGETQPCGGIGKTVWYRYTPLVNGVAVADTAGSTFDTVLAVYQHGYASPPGSIVNLVCGDDAGAGNATSTIAFSVLGGVTYYFQAGGKNGASGTLQFHLSYQTSADSDGDGCADAIEIANQGVKEPDNPLDRRDFPDWDHDAWVDFGDFVQFALVYGTVNGTFDLDVDGNVDFGDFVIFALAYGRRCM